MNTRFQTTSPQIDTKIMLFEGVLSLEKETKEVRCKNKHLLFQGFLNTRF